MTQYLYKITKQYPKIAQAEIETLIGEVSVLCEGWLISSHYNEHVFRLAFTKQVLEIIGCAEDWKDAINGVEDKYRVDGVGIDTIPVADEIYARYKKKVDIKKPKNKYVMLKADKYYFAKELLLNTDTGQERRSHKLPRNHPTTMHPLLAKAMINLAGANSFCDPMCGVGGILQEGVAMGLTCAGSDYSEEMIERAKENLAGIDISLKVKDVLTLDSAFEAIVTDLPYGKNSSISSIELYEKFFEHAKLLTDRMVVCGRQGYDVGDGWDVVRNFEVYVHASMTREIKVLKKS